MLDFRFEELLDFGVVEDGDGPLIDCWTALINNEFIKTWLRVQSSANRALSMIELRGAIFKGIAFSVCLARTNLH